MSTTNNIQVVEHIYFFHISAYYGLYEEGASLHFGLGYH